MYSFSNRKRIILPEILVMMQLDNSQCVKLDHILVALIDHPTKFNEVLFETSYTFNKVKFQYLSAQIPE